MHGMGEIYDTKVRYRNVLVYIIILCLIVSYKYPQNSENLMKMTSDDPFVIENKEFTLADYAYTENKSSFFSC